MRWFVVGVVVGWLLARRRRPTASWPVAGTVEYQAGDAWWRMPDAYADVLPWWVYYS